MRLRICHLYPDLMDLYGDRGNIITLVKRCNWRGIEVEIVPISLGQKIDFREMDLVFFGGGSDREQGLLFDDLSGRRENLVKAIEDGLVVLAICGGLQLLGRYYQIPDGTKIPGLEILDLWTIASNKRLIGNVCLEVNLGEGPNSLNTLVGFENHSGQTHLGQVKPLGKVMRGHGNNGQDGWEGAMYRNVFGTYLHGPLLPKNPIFTDHLLKLALQRRFGVASLGLLDDSLELAAHNYMLNRLTR
ncbi:MAG TPA: glutamine amidotransferase [Desulfobacteria bacterium]|nr:glutamine amidotransferase [Desulfobacteria bacterium]